MRTLQKARSCSCITGFDSSESLPFVTTSCQACSNSPAGELVGYIGYIQLFRYSVMQTREAAPRTGIERVVKHYQNQDTKKAPKPEGSEAVGYRLIKVNPVVRGCVSSYAEIACRLSITY